MNPAERKARDQDRDRRIVELVAMLALLPMLRTAAEHAAQAVRIGVDPAAAASAVLQGDPAVHQAGIAPVLASAATTAWLLGLHRSRANAAEHATGHRVTLNAAREALQGTPNVLHPPRRYADAVGRLVSAAGGPVAVSRYHASALVRTRPVVDRIDRRVAARLHSVSVAGPSMLLTPPPGAHTPTAIADAMQQVRLAFDRAGMGTRTSWYVEGRHPAAGEPNVSSAAETVVETIVGMDYDAGREFGSQAIAEMPEPVADVLPPALPPQRSVNTKPKLWGFTWSSVIDGRRCRYCRRLHGMTAPVGHAVWEVLRPICHHGCRCSRIDRYITPGQTLPLIRVPDLSDPDVLEAVRMRRELQAWWQGLPISL
ncbi:MAG TPA: hypothetical protein VF595_04190 [Tepidisphaeraceae bacterium]|jgi:hypothetical protein